MNPLHRNEEGAGMAEYVSAVAFIAIIAGASVSKLGQNVDATYGTSSNALAGSGEMLATEQVCSGGVCTRDGAACFVRGTPIDTAEGSKAIEAVALGDRVGPESAACESARTDDWREVDLRLTPDGASPGANDLQIRLLRSPAWFAENSASVGSQVSVSLEELNVRGLAYITRIREAPPIEPGSRCPVTGLMRHVSREVISVALQGGAALEVTRHHPLYSAARQEWVEAGELVAGEELVTRKGTARVAGISEGPAKPTEVFNLEVMEEHRYFAGDLQVLAHNQCLPWFQWNNKTDPENSPNVQGGAERGLSPQEQLARLRHVDDPAKIEESLKNDELFRQRKRDNQSLIADEQRLNKDLETAQLDRTRLNQMLHGDPARGGERLPLGFSDYGEFGEFKSELAAIIADIRVDGKPITASVRQIGTATDFYSGNPKKPLGHHFDRRAAEGVLGDVDIELSSPELVKAMSRVPGARGNPKVIVDGQMTIFKSSGAGGFGETYPQFNEFMDRWSRRLGREVDIKLKMDLTPIASLPKPRPGLGPIEILRRAQ